MKLLCSLSPIILLVTGCGSFGKIESAITDRDGGFFEVYITSKAVDSEQKLRDVMYQKAREKCSPRKIHEVGDKQEGLIVLILEGIPYPNERYIMEGLFECR
jgi:hypothetical protein